MSDQLKRILQENETIQEELEYSKNIIKVSEASKDLKSYATSTEDPLSPTYEGPNPYTDRQGGGGCQLL